MEPGRTVAVVGPNGAGKTTLIKALAGLVHLEAGYVVLDGTVLDAPGTKTFVPPEHRSVGVVFHHDALFPHMTALDNVAFGLRFRGTRGRAARRQADEWLERLGLGHVAGRRPRELSGGESRRVALARALAPQPKLLLLDEPLEGLDARTRRQIRHYLAQHVAAFGGAALLVAHQPLDALVLASELVVVEEGKVTQRGSADEIVGRPRTAFAAELVGTNLYRGTARGHTVELRPSGARLWTAGDDQGEVLAVVPPRAVALHRREPEGSPRNVWQGPVTSVEKLAARVRVGVGGPLPVVAEVTAEAVAALALAVGDPVWVAVKASEVEVFPE